MTLKIGALFAGYGGLDLAVQDVFPNSRLAWVSEIEKAPSKILAHRFPDAPNLGDITKVDWNTVEPVDIITGGSPCQDLSAAGRRAGMKPGTRSGLWASMCDAIEILRPSLVLWENVRGALSAPATIGDLEQCEFCVDEGGGATMRALGRVLGDLADIGYHAAWTGLRAADVGAPHGRWRVFVLAWPADSEREGWATAGVSTAGEASGGGSSAEFGGRGGAPVNLLPTPLASDGVKGGPNQRGGRGDLRLPAVAALFPTPTTTDGGSNSPADRARKSPGLRTLPSLLPTPVVNDMGAGYDPDEWQAKLDEWQAKFGNNGHGKSLSVEVRKLLPTPNTLDMLPAREGEAYEKAKLHGDGTPRETSGNLREVVVHHLLPTPIAQRVDGRKSEAFAEGRTTFFDLVQEWQKVPLLRTPCAEEAGGEPLHPDVAKERNQTLRLTGQILALTGNLTADTAEDEELSLFTVDEEALKAEESTRLTAQFLATTGREHLAEEYVNAWREYAPCIARWEPIIGRLAPSPVELSARGKWVLSPRFEEWMMGLPDGWGTDPAIEISRNEQLTAFGNGVVWQQGAEALRRLLEIRRRSLSWPG